MRIAVCTKGNDLDSFIDETFGRCEYFLIVDSETLTFETIENTAKNASGGAGIQAVKIVTDKNVEALLASNVGPNAMDLLNKANIKVYICKGSVKSAISDLKEGKLKSINSPTVKTHFRVEK